MSVFKSFSIVKSSCPDKETAQDLAKKGVSAKLVACAQILGPIESHYLWNGVTECSTEYLLILKTSDERLNDLISLIRTHHPYELPEIVTLPISGGDTDYLDWIHKSTL